MKRSNAKQSVRDVRHPAPTDRGLYPSLGHWGMRGLEDLTAEELVQLHQKLDGWIRRRALDPERTQRRPWVMQRHMAYPADRRESLCSAPSSS